MSNIENAIKTRPKGLWLLAALVAALAVGMALWGGGSGGQNTAQAVVNEGDWSVSNFVPPDSFPPFWFAGQEASAEIHGNLTANPTGGGQLCTGEWWNQICAFGQVNVLLEINEVFAFTSAVDAGSGSVNCQGLGTNKLLCEVNGVSSGSQVEIDVTARLRPYDPNAKWWEPLGCMDGRHIDLDGVATDSSNVSAYNDDDEAIQDFRVADGVDTEVVNNVPTGPGFNCRSLIITHHAAGQDIEGRDLVDKPSSHALFITQGAFLLHNDAGDVVGIDENLLGAFYCGTGVPELDPDEGCNAIDYGMNIWNDDIDIIQQNNISDAFGERWGYICTDDGEPVTDIITGLGLLLAGSLELCFEVHGEDGSSIDVAIVGSVDYDFAVGAVDEQFGFGPPLNETFDTSFADELYNASNILHKEWDEEPLELVHVQRFPTDDPFRDEDFDDLTAEQQRVLCFPEDGGEAALFNDSSECAGNDQLAFDCDGDGILDDAHEMLNEAAFIDGFDCEFGDDPMVDDNWNVIGSAHVVRTHGWQPGFVIDQWQLVPQLGSNVIILAGPGDCETVTKDSDLDFPDGTSLWDTFTIPYQEEIADEQCIAWTSNTPGETFVSLQFHDEGAFADGSGIDQPDDSVVNTVGPVIKEWNELTESLIIRTPRNFLSDTDNDDDNDGVDDLNDIDWQRANNIEGSTITADVNSRVTVLEIALGEHQTLGGPLEEVGKKVDTNGHVVVDVDHAIVWVDIDDPRGCTNVSATNLTPGTIQDEDEGEETGKVIITDAAGVQRVLEHGGVLLTFTADCEEVANINIHVDYPSHIASVQEGLVQHLTINWTTVEQAKEPIIKKAGEDHILEHRWTSGRSCDITGAIVVYSRLQSPSGVGSLINGYDAEHNAIASASSDSTAIAQVDENCISSARIHSEDPGEGDFRATLYDFFSSEDGGECSVAVVDSAFVEVNCGGGVSCSVAIVGSAFVTVNCTGGQIQIIADAVDTQDFLVWYVKLFSITLTNVPGDLVRPDISDDVIQDVCDSIVDGVDYNRDGEVDFQSDWQACVDSAEMDRDRNGIIEEWEGLWTPTPNVFEPNTQGALPSTDVRSETLNATDFGLIRIHVKDYLYLANNSGRPDTCIDMDGDGNGSAGAAPGPYPSESHVGCPDADDEVLTAGYWVLPDDFATLAGFQPAQMRGSWNVLFGPPEAAAHFAMASQDDAAFDELFISAAEADQLCRDLIDLDLDGDADVDWNGDGVTNNDDFNDCEALFSISPRQFAEEFLIGPKREVDTHDGTIRPWVTYDGAQIWYNCTGDFVDEDANIGDYGNNGSFLQSNMVPDWIDYGFEDAGDCIEYYRNHVGSGNVINEDAYKSMWPNFSSPSPTAHIINIWDALMPLEKITLKVAGAGSLLAVDKEVVYPGGINPYYQVFVPANDLIDAMPSGGGYDWDSTQQGPYQFWYDLQRVLGPAPADGQIRQISQMQFYSDNHGEAMALIYGNANLSFADCSNDPITGTKVCEPGDVVGQTTLTAIADYPYFRKHRDIKSAPDLKTWVWGGYKRVTLHPVVSDQGVVDPNHTYVVTHLLSRDAECDLTWDGVGPGVNGEPVDFEISGDGVIVDADLPGGIDIGGKSATAISGNAADFGGSLPFPNAGSAEECQAFILVEHGEKAAVQVSIVFHEPEGDIRTSAPVFPSGSVDLEVVKTGPSTANAGENVTYTIAVKNVGAFVAHDVQVIDTPSIGSVVSMSPVGGLIGTIQPGQTVNVTVVVAVPQNTADGTVLVNSAVVSAAQQDMDLSNNTTTVNTTINATFPVVTLFPGWNFVEWKAAKCAESVDAFAQLTNPDIFNVAWTWNAQTQEFDKSYDDDAPSALNTLQKICTGDILAIHVSQKVEWEQIGTE